jgi:hypothetical protein
LASQPIYSLRAHRFRLIKLTKRPQEPLFVWAFATELTGAIRNNNKNERKLLALLGFAGFAI